VVHTGNASGINSLLGGPRRQAEAQAIVARD
jgi:hypothetical protein